jgi:hypothetical protein
VSVVGEYRRILDDLSATLAGSSSPAAQRFANALDQAQLERAPHVSVAAERALAIIEGEEALAANELDSAIERERVADQLDHFVAICRVVLGH